MPICDRLRAALRASACGAAGLLLTGCDPSALTGGAPSRATVSVAGAAVTIAAPAGFCIDSGSTNQTADGAFLLLGDCALLAGPGGTASTPVRAALTASVSTGGFGEGDAASSLGDLQAFAASPAGLAALGRSGQVARIRILATQTRGEVLYVLVEDRGRLPIAGIDRQFWRAFLEVNDRMTALSVLGFEGTGLTPQDGLTLLVRFADAVQAANRA